MAGAVRTGPAAPRPREPVGDLGHRGVDSRQASTTGLRGLASVVCNLSRRPDRRVSGDSLQPVTLKPLDAHGRRRVRHV